MRLSGRDIGAESLQISLPAIRGLVPKAHLFHKLDVEEGSHWFSVLKGSQRGTWCGCIDSACFGAAQMTLIFRSPDEFAILMDSRVSSTIDKSAVRATSSASSNLFRGLHPGMHGTTFQLNLERGRPSITECGLMNEHVKKPPVLALCLRNQWKRTGQPLAVKFYDPFANSRSHLERYIARSSSQMKLYCTLQTSIGAYIEATLSFLPPFLILGFVIK